MDSHKEIFTGEWGKSLSFCSRDSACTPIREGDLKEWGKSLSIILQIRIQYVLLQRRVKGDLGVAS